MIFSDLQLDLHCLRVLINFIEILLNIINLQVFHLDLSLQFLHNCLKLFLVIILDYLNLRDVLVVKMLNLIIFSSNLLIKLDLKSFHISGQLSLQIN